MSSAHHHSKGFQGARPQTKSPLPAKKSSAKNNNNYQHNQKQSLKQLGISYGILAKQDTQNKLVSSKNKRGGVAKSKDNQQQYVGNNLQTSPKKGLREKKNSHVDNIYKISAPPVDQDGIVLEGSKLISYDEQTALTPIQSQHALVRSAAQSHGRIA